MDGTSRADVFDTFAVVMKALSNGRRLELLELLAQGEHPVEMLARMTGMQLTTASAHLKVLREASLVHTRREGTTIHYSLAGEDVAALYVLAKRTALIHSPELRRAADDFMAAAGPAGPVVDVRTLDESWTVLDVRPGVEYDAGHVAGAVSIPLDELGDRVGELSRARPVAIYCRGELCHLARRGASILQDHGFDAVALDEGILEWRADASVPLVTP